MYVTGLKKQAIAFETEGPKAPNIIGGKRGQTLIQMLNTVLNTITIACEGVHIGAMYDVPADGFSWTDQDGLMTIVNATPAVSGGIIDSGNGPGTLIARAYNNDPAITTIFLPQG